VTTRDQILAYIRDSRHSPTIAEIAQHVGRSKSTVHAHLDALERNGFIRRISGRVYPSERVA
jgi:DNA-binding IclR family transcriptional regulator